MPSTDIYTLSLHDALPILYQENQKVSETSALGWTTTPWRVISICLSCLLRPQAEWAEWKNTIRFRRNTTPHMKTIAPESAASSDRKSTRLNSSHVEISYAVHRHLHSFPTRRSSDLVPRESEGQ